MSRSGSLRLGVVLSPTADHQNNRNDRHRDENDNDGGQQNFIQHLIEHDDDPSEGGQARPRSGREDCLQLCCDRLRGGQSLRVTRQLDHGRSGTIVVIHVIWVSTRAVVSALVCGQSGPVLSVATSTGASPGGVVK